MKILITGGHHTSALPVINELKKRKSEVDICWVGHRHSIQNDKNDTLEYKEITSLGIPFYELKAGKIYKTLNLRNLLKIPIGFIQAYLYVYKTKPDVILSFGGYIAAPIVLAGYLLKVPIVTHEQTVVTGYANKFISFFATKILLTWESSKKFYDEIKDKVVISGLPLRKEIFNSTSNNFSLNPNLPTIYITCGKTGSHVVNEAINSNMEDILNVCNVIHQCGDTSFTNDYDTLLNTYKFLKVKGIYNLRKYVLSDEIGEAFSKANLVICRSGAHTIYELLALKKPAILIPISWVSHNEQLENATVLEKCGLGVILHEDKLISDGILKTLNRTLERVTNLNIKDMPSIKTNAEIIIVDEILKTFNSK